MAIKKQVDILQRGAIAWNAWRVKHPNETIDCSGAILSGAILSGAILSGAILYKATLYGADLSRADLSGADLSGANLSNTKLSNADLSQANLSNANFTQANLTRANLAQANLTRAIFNDANLSDASLSRTNLTHANLTQAYLSGADLGRANLTQADFTQADLTQADLSGANLNTASFKNTEVGWTIFGDLDLRTIKDLETIQHKGPSYVSTSTLSRSQGNIPKVFLRGAGLNDFFIEYVHSLISRPHDYHTCFISYSSNDDFFARRLHNDLQHEGIRCWLAPEDMDIGDTIKPRIDESIRLYDKLVLILSKPSIESNWIAYEVEKALSKEPHRTPNVLYPVCIDQTILTCTELWAQKIKETRQITNFTYWTNPEQYQNNFRRLLRALTARKEQIKI